MRYLILGMIAAGSVLMVYNILRYGFFVKKNNELEHRKKSDWRSIVPMLLLIFFLIGYLVVGASGIADLMVASILLGGSIFVFLLLWVMYSIVGHVRDTEQILSARYEEIKQQITAITKDSMTVFRVNLTRDEIEERSGDYLYESDLKCDRYSDLVVSREEYILDKENSLTERGVFTREGLLKQYRDGMTNVSDVVLVRRGDGTASFVKIEAILTKKPVSDDVVAFIIESPYNEEIVRKTLLERVLMGEYDRIAFVINGNYKVLISNTGKKSGMLLPDDKDDTYESVYLNYILPAMAYDREKNNGKPNPLRLSVIDKELGNKDFYDVDAPFTIDGVTYYKHFAFYKISDKVKFYLMLLSDSTKTREEQEKQTRELSEALAAAVRSNESRIKFFTNVSHNLRTPMNGILGFAELASHEDDMKTVQSYITKITASGHQLIARINDLFDMSLIENKTLKLELKPTDLYEFTESAAARFKEELSGKELTVKTDISGVKDRNVICDAQRLGRVIGRLLENSAAFAPDNTAVELSVTQSGEGDICDYVFRVRNAGIGIPDDVVGRIFEPEVWNVGKDLNDVPGAGIGMSVAKALIDQMGGEASAKTEEGDVVTIDVRVPLEVVRDGKEEKEKISLGSLRLLVTDDNEINREIAQLILEGDGHTVDLAVNGADALEKIKTAEKMYDAVLMDVQMPVMNGYEATGAIRALPDPVAASVPIIAMTANAYQEDQNEALNAGMDGYISKPIEPDGIRDALKKVLKG